MNNQGLNEKDWQLFRNKIGDWQEAYMDKLNKEYVELLNSNMRASEKFWKLEERINKDKHSVGVIAKMSRSNLYSNLIGLLNDGVITLNDLDGFSKDLRERLTFLTR